MTQSKDTNECKFKRGQVWKNPEDTNMMVTWVYYDTSKKCHLVNYVTEEAHTGHFFTSDREIVDNCINVNEPLALTPPQSPNRAVLDALKSIIFDIECLEPIKKMHLEDAYKAISDAEKECVDYETEIREFISEQFKKDGTPYITEEKNCILLGMPVDANTADWFTKLRAFEHLKRQKGR